jgi:predicted aspartyl protease
MRHAGFGLAVFLLSASPAGADDCTPPTLENQVQMTAIKTGDGSQIDAVPISINGQQTQFLFDTGGIFTQISAALAGQLQIPINRTSDALVDVTGRQAAGLVMIHEFRMGRQTRNDVPLPVSPDPVVTTGLLSLNDLTPHDAEVDFGANVLKFFSQDHCPGVTPMPPSAAVIPFSLRKGHITVAVTLDGKTVTAIVDTGSTGTNLRADVAKSVFGLSLGGPDTPENGQLEGVTGLVTYGHVFGSLALGAIAVASPHVTIIPDRASDGSAITLGGPELIIGMNVLKTLHIYFAFREGKMYVSQAIAP